MQSSPLPTQIVRAPAPFASRASVRAEVFQGAKLWLAGARTAEASVMLTRFHRTVVVADPDDTVERVAGQMRDGHVGSVVVVRAGRPIGIVTDRDLAMRVLAEGRDPRGTPVRDVMSRAPCTIADHRSIDSALHALRDAGVRRLPLVDAQGELVGIVTSDDLVKLLAEELGSLASGLDNAVDASDLR